MPCSRTSIEPKQQQILLANTPTKKEEAQRKVGETC